MIDDLIELREKFNQISNSGWFMSKRKGPTGIGYTFESLLGKEEESFSIPDFGSIEIKTRFRNSKRGITLFNATPDGDYLFSIKNIYEKYKFPSKSNHKYKVFYADISTEPKYAGAENKFKLYVDDYNKKISVICIDKYGNHINTEVSWSFKNLKEKLERKLKFLALVKADAKCDKNDFELQYFHYYSITFYALKDFETFISLIKNGIIKTTFMIGCYKKGPKEGQMDNHGVGFDINENDLDKLFIKLE